MLGKAERGMEMGGGAAGGGGARARLMITSMTLHNFKSYGGTKEIGPFHKSFSSVVGPNGSGKSNVIDAMLFVFGMRAKKLRQSNLAGLVHRSKEFPDLDHAEVTVRFQEIVDRAPREGESESEAFDVVPGSEFTVKRRIVKRAGGGGRAGEEEGEDGGGVGASSSYYVSGKASSFTEVTKLLKSKGVDLDHNRFLILQGEVEQISLMKPKGAAEGESGLLEYLEDIIGSNRYLEEIEQLGKELEALTEARTDKLNRVKLAERERDALAADKEEAEAVLEKEEAVIRARHVLVARQLLDTRARADEAQSRAAALADKKTKEEGRLAAEEAKVAAAEEDMAVTRREADAQTKALAELKATFKKLEKDDIAADGASATSVEAYKRAKKTAAAQRARESELQEGVGALEEAMPALERERDAAMAARERAEAARDDAMASLPSRLGGKRGGGSGASLRDELQEVQAALAPLQQRKTQAGAALGTKRTQLELGRQARSRRAIEETRRRTEREALEMRKGTAEAEVHEVAGKRAQAQERLAALHKELEAARGREAALAERVRTLRTHAAASRQNAEQMSSRSTMLRALHEAATRARGELASAGFRGRLGDLGCIDGKYDVAVSTACGALDWLVVDTAEGGQKCIDFLRKHNLGRARFIALDKIGWAAEQMAHAVALPEDAVRLFDLVKPASDDAPLRAAFFFAMRNTLVVPTLDQAVRVAYRDGKPAWRVVTLTGELIDTSGTMSGGGGRAAAARGLLRIAKGDAAAAASALGDTLDQATPEASEAAAKRDEKEADKLVEELATARQAVTALEHEERALQERVDQLTARHDRAAAILAGVASRVKDLDAPVAAAEDSSSDIPSEQALDALAREVDALEREFKAAADGARGLEERAAEMQNRLLGVGDKVCEAANAAFAKASALADAKDQELTRAKSDLVVARAALAKAHDAAARAEEEQAQAAKALEALRAQRAETEAKAQECMGRIAEAEAALAEVEKRAAALDAQRAAAEDAARKIRVVLEEISTALDELKRAHKAATTKLAELQATQLTIHKEFDALMREVPAPEALPDAPAAAAAAVAAAAEGKEEDEEEGEGAGARPAQFHPVATWKLALQDVSDEAALAAMDLKALQVETSMLEQEFKDLKAATSGQGISAIKQWRAKNREYMERVAELERVSAERDGVRKRYDAMRKERLDSFMAGFGTITLKLKEMYQMITLGGDAELELVDPLDPFSDGIVFSVRPPKKSWKNIVNLSGGEKTLASLALVFALHHYKPTPLYVMDEIDAALDFKNVSIVANYIKERTKDAQFIIISLRNNMFELADRLVGIYKTHDVTKSVTINPKEFVLAPAAPSAAASAATAARRTAAAAGDE